MMVDRPGSWASPEGIWCWFMIFQGTHSFPGGEAGSCSWSSLCPFSRPTIQWLSLSPPINIFFEHLLCVKDCSGFFRECQACPQHELYGAWTLYKAACGHTHERDRKCCVHGGKKSSFKLGGSRTALQRVTLELRLGEQVWLGSERRDWQTTACRPNPFSLPILEIKLYWKSATPAHWCIVYGCFHATVTELSNCDRDYIVLKG